ncbi:acetyl-CoA carboxylase carboxyltransferase subunit alpha [Pelagibacteraceae bacterium]|nr:acetyl-CoA carboxylase carboxyltransferase subunit alpha [Pelagibacteraceae bacterium]
MINYFEFEKDIEKIDKFIFDLDKNDNKYLSKLDKLNFEKKKKFEKIYSNLEPWQKVQVSRHNDRPHAIFYIQSIFEDIVFLHGDKKYADDNAIIGGLAKINNHSIVFIGTEKGNTMETRLKHNFGMAKPEGYRKSQRLVSLAEKFNLPIISFVDTAGAFPGKDAEERGQSESIASSILSFLKVKIPTISVIIGEGGSGGAIGIATSDVVLMLEHSTYSVISPEGCASILWRSTNFTQEAANTLKLTSEDCKKFKIVDSIIPELSGGAHRNASLQAELVKKYIFNNIEDLKKIPTKDLIENRKNKYLNITSDI